MDKRYTTKGYVIRSDLNTDKPEYFARFSGVCAFWTFDKNEVRKVFATKADAQAALDVWGSPPEWMTIVRLVARKRGNGNS